MNSWLRLILVLLLLLAAASRADDQQSLHYLETELTLELTVPAGGVWLVIPRQGFERLRPLASGAPGPRSFDLVDREHGIEIFGAFDSAAMYPGLQRYWAEELEAMQLEEAPQPRNVQITREGDWEVVAYETAKGNERSSHVRAQAIRDQTWIDVHIRVSATGDAATLHQTAQAILGDFRIRED
jgi:hypothetical protein